LTTNTAVCSSRSVMWHVSQWSVRKGTRDVWQLSAQSLKRKRRKKNLLKREKKEKKEKKEEMLETRRKNLRSVSVNQLVRKGMKSVRNLSAIRYVRMGYS
jgi:hypothetical protein